MEPSEQRHTRQEIAGKSSSSRNRDDPSGKAGRAEPRVPSHGQIDHREGAAPRKQRSTKSKPLQVCAAEGRRSGADGVEPTRGHGGLGSAGSRKDGGV